MSQANQALKKSSTRYARGTVTSVKETYCFIRGAMDGVDRFAHKSEFNPADWANLKAHQMVRFEVADMQSTLGPRAVNVRVIDPAAARPDAAYDYDPDEAVE